MDMANIIIAGLFLLVILYLMAQIFFKPVKLLWKILLNSLIGLVLLLATNYVGSFWQFSLPVNIITVLISGFLGLPGVLLLIAFKLLI